MKVVFLCGGIGRRLFPITEDKFLLKFLGKTLLEHQIEMAKRAGLTEFVIVGNHENIGSIKEVVSGIPDIKAEFAIQEEPLGIASALHSAGNLLDSEIIVLNPNDVFDVGAYTRLLEARLAGSAVSYILGHPVTEYFPGGYLVVNEEGDLTHIIEKPGKGKEPSNLVNLLVHLHTDPKRLLKYAASVQTSHDDVYECAINAMARDTCRVKVIPYIGLWNAIKYPWDIFAVVRRFLAQGSNYISPSARISDKAAVTGEVVIDHNVTVLENAVVRGPAYIGPNSVIGNNSLVREYSHIGANCFVGYSTEIKGSYIGDGCWFHMSYIGDAIIGDGCSFAAGTVLANFRFDERNISVKIEGEPVDTGLNKLGAIIGNNCKTGVNVSVMPGVKIGPNCIVGPHVCLTEDLESGKTVMAEQVHKTIRNTAGPDQERTQNAPEMIGGLRCAE